MRVMPLIVIACLLFSWIESVLILPAHLSHVRRRRDDERQGLWTSIQRPVAGTLVWFIDNVYRPSLEFGLRWRYTTLAVGMATLVLMGGLVAGGFVRFVFMPSVESDFLAVSLTMPQGTPVEVTSTAVRQLEVGAERLREELREQTGQDLFQHALASVGSQPYTAARRQNLGQVSLAVSAAHLGEVTIELLPSENRPAVSSEAMADRWRQLSGTIPDAVDVSFSASLFSAGEDVNVQLTGPDLDRLQAAAGTLKERLGEYAGVYEIADSFRSGKRELKLGIKPAAELLGLSLADLGRQVRQAFYGEEGQRIQRGRDDVRVMIRYPEEQRRSLGDLEEMRIRTPNGDEVPFNQVAVIEGGRGFAAFQRVDRRRAISVTAAVDETVATPGDIAADLRDRVLPEVLAQYPGVRYSFEGMAAEQRDTMGGLIAGFGFALLMIYGLLAVPLRSYLQPIIIMSAIPFGLVGAVMGHIIMRMDLTILSLFGVVALAGVVVNDSLVLVDFINRRRAAVAGATADLAATIREAGAARFRPILLTSLTTFAGLLPMLLEKSMQARFLIPMAVSLAFGVMFSTFVTLILVPCSYMILNDLINLRPRQRAAPASESLQPQPRIGAAPAAAEQFLRQQDLAPGRDPTS